MKKYFLIFLIISYLLPFPPKTLANERENSPLTFESLLKELEDLKMKESVSEVPVPLEKKQEFIAPVPRHEDILENFEDLKMKESVSEVP
ncbi:MAG: hypothetical protein VB778_06055, partial [Nitrospinaceae bacterium]